MSVVVPGFKSSEVLEELRKQLETDESLQAKAKKIGGTFSFTVKNKSGKQQSFLLDLRSCKLSKIDITEAKKQNAQIITSDLSLKKLVTGKDSPTSLYLSGRLKIRGDVTKATVLSKIFAPKSKL